MLKRVTFAAAMLLFSVAIVAQPAHPILPLGSSAPDFSLAGVDSKIHKLSDYASSPILVVVFTCNNCPIAQMYDAGIDASEELLSGFNALLNRAYQHSTWIGA